MIIGQYIDNIKCESFIDSETKRVRIRPLPNQEIPNTLLVECRKEFRDANKYPIGTKFIAENVKVCKKTTGRIYLRAKDQNLTQIR